MMARGAIPPGSVIGIIGGGQLGRMTALAAARLGYRCHIFSPQADGPAAQVSAACTVAEYDDHDALAGFADAVDVVTFEFENIPHESVRLLAARVPVRPHWEALRISQDRLVEKDFLNANGAPTVAYRAIKSAADLAAGLDALGGRGVLKTTRLGYDGKGQRMVDSPADLQQAWAAMATDVAILEAHCDFEREISVIIARGTTGKTAAYCPVDNVHKNHLLHRTTAPSTVAPGTAKRALMVAGRVVRALDLVGLLAVEMFVTRAGNVLVNEIAPRPHNSGHWTIDACPVSQFEQFVRAVTGLPLGDPARHSDAVMTNLVGNDVDDWRALAREPGACLHLYGKAETRAGRKMGHVTRLIK